MNYLKGLDKKELRKIKLIVFDVDGVIVPRGTKIKQVGDTLTLNTKKVGKDTISQIKKLNKLGFKINISSGRGLYMLQAMFREVLDEVILTYENGSASWVKGKIYQHFNSHGYMKKIIFDLMNLKDKRIKGFEPKEHIITIHCTQRVKKIENAVGKYKNLHTVWNGEAYDIGVKKYQTKAKGLKKLSKLLKIKKKNVMFTGDNYNDKELMKLCGLKISADKSRLKGDYYLPLNGKKLPANMLMEHIIKVF